MKNQFIFLITVFFLLTAAEAKAHFGMIIPSTNIISPADKTLGFTLSFSHPFTGVGMDLNKPQALFILSQGKQTDLLDSLTQTTVMGKMAWTGTTVIKCPGVYWLVMEPSPYWEAAENIFIQHITKTVVAAFGAEEGWDTPLDLPVEIVPLLRPFGNYAGNSFTGKVMIKGEPAPNTAVEVEYYNTTRQQAPSEYHVTQVIKTDENGNFTFTCPWPGWWGFAALSDADYTLNGPDGREKHVELGAVLWISFDKALSSP
jgi:cobalt/nickel transport protein